ncbi:hypothetical protein LSH36_1313g00018 [Paralvinella palmiformis]|uniref:Protein kinase domain-containing protein n=1 Tax=Paralvinella palmiformis TaxID=53620 RepID=A0AAD9MQZ4_9ANNE|nr:hypothetical protein LSH36_1313g00018 [Paralvinella palmiformis]
MFYFWRTKAQIAESSLSMDNIQERALSLHYRRPYDVSRIIQEVNEYFTVFTSEELTYDYENERTENMLTIKGNLPIPSLGRTVPLRIWLPLEFPLEQPIAEIIETESMLRNPAGNLVENNKIQHKYLEEWNGPAPRRRSPVNLEINDFIRRENLSKATEVQLIKNGFKTLNAILCLREADLEMLELQLADLCLLRESLTRLRDDSGLAVIDEMPYLVLPFMTNGDLLGYVKVDGDSNAKISDFGMARQLHQSDYMKIFRPKVATRWMAPEIFTENKFTLQSDVWSYGILFWEVLTRGKRPYENIPYNKYVATYIIKGNSMSLPDYVPEKVRQMVSKCWEMTAKSRPSFSDVVCCLNEALSYERCCSSTGPGMTTHLKRPGK